MKELTVLLAEDNQEQALLITKALNRNVSVGQVIHFPTGREVLSFLFGLADYNLPGERFVLLMDVHMQHVNGLEVLKVIKNHDALKSLPVIMFSSVTDPQIMDLCYYHGCNAFVPRPSDPEELENLSILDFISIMQVPSVPADIISKIASGVVK